MIRLYIFCLVASLSGLMLSSCATVEDMLKPEKHTENNIAPVNWAEQQEKRQQIKNWEIRGRLGVQTETDGATLDIIWKQAGEDYTIRLIAPLGAGSYLIQGDNQSAQIRFPDGRKQTSNNIDDIFRATLKVDLPVTAIKDWIRGMPAADLSVEKIRWNNQGLLESLEQSGWNVSLEEYTGTEILLPYEIYLSRDDDEELEVRLLFRRWLIDN